MFNLAIIATTLICALPLIYLVAFGLTVAFGLSFLPMLVATIASIAFFGAAGWVVIKGITTGQ